MPTFTRTRVQEFLLLLLAVLACNRNHPPVISNITCEPDSYSAGTLFTLVATARDEDGDAMEYAWTANGGSFTDSTDRSRTSWKSPVDGSGMTYTLRVSVSDGASETFMDYPILLTDPVFGRLAGYAYFSNCTVPVEGAVVSVEEKTAATDAEGFFTLGDIPVGSYTLRAIKTGFEPADKTITVYRSANPKVAIPMTSTVWTGMVYGIVRDQDNLAIGGTRITMLNPDGTESRLFTLSEVSGLYRLWSIPFGHRAFVARKEQTEQFGFAESRIEADIAGPELLLNIGISHYELTGRFSDPRDAHQYGYKILGTQTWMTDNLAWLPVVSPSTEGSADTKLYYVYMYEGTSTREAKTSVQYATNGVLYNAPASITACPQGWHLPSDTEWKILEHYLGSDAGFRMKSVFGWTNQGNGNNSSGFNAMPGGSRLDRIGFDGLGTTAQFWSATVVSGHGIWNRTLVYNDHVLRRLATALESGISIRCVKN